MFYYRRFQPEHVSVLGGGEEGNTKTTTLIRLPLTIKVHSHERQRLRLRLGQKGLLKLQHVYEDIASNAKNGFYTHSLHLTQCPH